MHYRSRYLPLGDELPRLNSLLETTLFRRGFRSGWTVSGLRLFTKPLSQWDYLKYYADFRFRRFCLERLTGLDAFSANWLFLTAAAFSRSGWRMISTLLKSGRLRPLKASGSAFRRMLAEPLRSELMTIPSPVLYRPRKPFFRYMPLYLDGRRFPENRYFVSSPC